jgi:hypothetical protein
MTGLVWDVDKLRIATDAAGVALWSWNVDTDRLELDERGHVLWGVPNTGTITFEILSSRIGGRSFAIMPTASPRWICSSYRQSRFVCSTAC